MSEGVNTFWGLIQSTLTAMSEVYVKIKAGTASQAEKNGFLAQGNALGLHSGQLFEELKKLEDAAEAGAMSRIHHDLAALLAGDLKNARALCRDLVRQLLRIANFHVLHDDGDQALWKPVQKKYQKMLDALPTE
ncbi:hypothetical protein [Roseibium sp. Sym1]|uniref:hypothetical protein n=1 Tax=Roseibium sp. Sym1 TaxID=3016006 RepID=UPI0022B547F5|nr:hypothetical protein [Roseibium sp. Sym1]